LRASCIIVVDDHVASDYFCESVIRMAVPREVEVIICGLKEFAETYSFQQGIGKKTIVLFSKIADALTVYRLGFRFDKLNIGNVYNEECKIRCTASVLLSDGDVRDLSALRAEGVQIDLQPVPREKPVDYFDIVQAT
jgi:mannose/fructose/N-acetylgalactosamine-specific phosphotransferase system component IIB